MLPGSCHILCNSFHVLSHCKTKDINIFSFSWNAKTLEMCVWQTCAVRKQASWEAQPSHQPHGDQRMTSQSLFPVHRPRQIYGIYKRSGEERRAARGREEWDGMTEQEGKKGGGQRENEDQRRSSRGLEMEAKRRQRRVRVTAKRQNEEKRLKE